MSLLVIHEIKGYKYFDPLHCKFYNFADVFFLESLPYIAPTGFSHIPQPMHIFKDLEKETVPNSLQVYIKLSKEMVFTPC